MCAVAFIFRIAVERTVLVLWSMIPTLSVVSKFHGYNIYKSLLIIILLCSHVYTYAHMLIHACYYYTYAYIHTCTSTVCPSLSLANGDVSYSPTNRDIGSVATYTCNPGYRLSSPQAGMTRICSVNGWSDQNFTCGIMSFVATYSGNSILL